MVSDEQIIRRILRGDMEAFRELMHRYQGGVFALAYRFFGRREDAEDVVQETFLRVYQNLADCRDTHKPWSWIRRIALNICLRNVPKESPSDDVEYLVDLESLNESIVESDVLDRMQAEDVLAAVVCLPPTYRSVIVLRYLEDMPCSAIAETLDRPLSTVKVQLHRGIRMLSERLVGVT